MKNAVIGYGKIGRSWRLNLAAASTVGGDVDVIRGLERLAPRVGAVRLVGHCSRDDPGAMGFSKTTNPWHANAAEWQFARLDHGAYIEKFLRLTKKIPLDALVVWVGQHAPVNQPIPFVGTDWRDGVLIRPPFNARYVYCLVALINERRLAPVFLCPDPRTMLQLRDFKDPWTTTHGPILAQWTGEDKSKMRYEQYDRWPRNPERAYGPGHREESVWVSDVPIRYEYAAVELFALDRPDRIAANHAHDRAHPFGIVVNENLKTRRNGRLEFVRDWILASWPRAPIYGVWSEESQAALGRTITPVPVASMYDVLRTFRATITLPASGSGWATAKPWECFAAGTVCFFHPAYDEQNNILGHRRYGTDPGLAELRAFLRVDDAAELRARVRKLNREPGYFKLIVGLQRLHFERAFRIWDGGMAEVTKALRRRLA